MIPVQTRLGHSFKGAGMYYLHDKDADTSERVAFTHTENIPTEDPHKALKWMAWTAIHAEELKQQSGARMTGQPCRKPVFAFSLAWNPLQDPHKWEMVGAGREALAAIELSEHETLMVAHSDTEHPHLHLIVNTVHPETGVVNTLPYSKLKLSKWAEDYEREHGKIYCEQRVENNERRDQGEFVRYREPELDVTAHITQLYHASDTGTAFQAALAESGYRLAQGKRIVVIDQTGKIHSLSRHIENVSAKKIRAKLRDLVLQPVDEERATGGHDNKAEKKPEQRPSDESPASAQPKEGETQAQKGRAAKPIYIDRDKQDRKWQESIIDAAISTNTTKPPEPEINAPQAVSPAVLNRLQDRQLAELGNFGTEKHLARLQLEATLDDYYGPNERELRNDIASLEQVLKNSGKARIFWLKLTRQIPRNAEAGLHNMRRSLKNIETLKSAYQHELESDIRQQREQLDARLLQERLELQPNSDGNWRTRNDVDEEPDVDLDEDIGPSPSY